MKKTFLLLGLSFIVIGFILLSPFIIFSLLNINVDEYRLSTTIINETVESLDNPHSSMIGQKGIEGLANMKKVVVTGSIFFIIIGFTLIVIGFV